MKVLFEHFYKNKAYHRKQTAQLVFSVVIVLLKFNFCLRNVFNRSIRQVENEKLFISLRVLSESSKTCYFSTVLALLLLTMV